MAIVEQDRWEGEDGGWRLTYTLGAEIAALLVAAEWAEQMEQPELALHSRATADSWNAQIGALAVCQRMLLARRCGGARLLRATAQAQRRWRGGR
ncbi:MAG: hypothetical protein U1F35_07935 [Steroidobacteraceae bacterium]